MEIFKSARQIGVERFVRIRTNEIQIGDRIAVNHYTATCQAIAPNGALFLLDQYLDRAYKMNRMNTNEGGYEGSILRGVLRSKEILDIFKDYSDRMVPFDNGDLLRIPFFGELFGRKNAECYEPDGRDQWPLMKDWKNRNAFRKNEWEWGLLQNRRKRSRTLFAGVYGRGSAGSASAWDSGGVRPAFLIN